MKVKNLLFDGLAFLMLGSIAAFGQTYIGGPGGVGGTSTYGAHSATYPYTPFNSGLDGTLSAPYYYYNNAYDTVSLAHGRYQIGTWVNGAWAVNNQFGAGESSTIQGMHTITMQSSGTCTTDYVTWPNYHILQASTPVTIHLGSTLANGQNIVINSYNAGGHIEGWYYQWKATWSSGNMTLGPYCDDNDYSTKSYPSGIIPPTAAPSWNVESGNRYNISNIIYGYQTNGISTSLSLGVCHSVSVSHVFSLSAWTTFSPYVTGSPATPNGGAPADIYLDNSIPLIQTIGGKDTTFLNAAGIPYGVYDDVSYTGRGTVRDAKTTGTANDLELYVRPTTVAVKDDAAFDEILFEPIEWWYNTYEVQNTILEDYTHIDRDWGYCSTSVSSWLDCGDGDGVDNNRQYTFNYVGNGVWMRHVIHDVWWLETQKKLGTTKLDAAVQLLAGSNVLVKGNITDAAGTVQSATGYANSGSTTSVLAGGNETDALLVFPLKNGTTNKFELRVGGDFKAINMIHDGNNNNLFYTAQAFPKSAGGNPAAATEPQNKSNNGTIFLYNNSVIGVKGDYDYQKNATILTDSTPGSPADRGMIEVGTNTKSSSDATDGAFYVTSGSYFKNLSDLLCLFECEQVNISATNAPRLLITSPTDTVKIINDNLCCDMDGSINFKDAEAEAMFNNAFDGTSIGSLAISTSMTFTDGPIEVHANHGSVNFDVPMALEATMRKNNLAVISDASYIRTKDFSFTTGDGSLLMHTNQEDCFHSSINMDGDVVIEHKTSSFDPITQYRNQTGRPSTYPYYSWQAVDIAKYGTSDASLPYGSVVTVQGDVCVNPVDANGLANAGIPHLGDTLTNFQSVFRANEDSIWMKSLSFKSEDGGLLVQALGASGNGTVEIGDNTTGVLAVDLLGNADVAIQSVQDSVKIGKSGNTGSHTYDADANMEGDFLVSGHKGVFIHGNEFTTTPLGNQDIVIAAEQGPVLFDAKNVHTQGETGHYLVYGWSWVDFLKPNTIDQITNTTTDDYAKIWSPYGWIANRDVFTYNAGNHTPLIILAEGGTHGGGVHASGVDGAVSGSVSFEGAVTITHPANSDGITQIQSVNQNVNIKEDFTFKNTSNYPYSGNILIQAGTDIYADDGISNTSNSKTLTFDHYGDGQIILEAHQDIDLWSALVVTQLSTNHGEMTFKAGYKANTNYCYSKEFTDTTYIRNPYNLTEYLAPSQSCGNFFGNIFFRGDATITYTGSSSKDTLASVFNAYRSVYINNMFTYLTEEDLKAENHSIDHHAYATTAGNILVWAETGNVEAVRDEDGSTGDEVNITVDAPNNNNADIRIQAGPYLCMPNCSNYFDQDHGNILFNKPLNITSNGSGYTILQAHRDIETQVDAPAVFTHKSILGNSLTDSATLLVAGRHIETHSIMLFDYDNTALDGSITLQAGKMDHPEGLDIAGNWACTDYLCKTSEIGSNLWPAGAPYDPSLNVSPPNDITTAIIESNMSQGGLGNGSILLFDTLAFNYYGDSTISLIAYNGDIETDPYLHKASRGAILNVGYSSRNNIHNAPIIFNHAGTGVTQLRAIDIKLHDKLDYIGTSNRAYNGQLHILAYDSILTRNLKYVNQSDTGSVFIVTSKYKYIGSATEQCGLYTCAADGPGIHQGHIVLGYGADSANANLNDSIVFDFRGNTQVTGANVHILAGFEGFNKNNITGKGNDNTLFNGGTNLTDLWSLDKGKNKGYGGNITFDYSQYYMSNGGNTEILTPNGNIWGKDSISYHGFDGNLTIDAGLGSVDNKFNIRWTGFSCPGSNEDMLNTQVPFLCDSVHPWRTGNVMLKGGHLTFANDMGAYGNGDAIIRTREGYIDVYDAFTIDSMQGDFYVYAGMDNLATGRNNAFGDISFRDFKYNPTQNSGNIFLGADDNIMLNYGNSNGNYAPYGSATGTPPGFPLNYDIEPEYFKPNPYYSTPWKPNLNDQISYATYDVNTDGYLWYKNPASRRWRNLHRLYRGCYVPSDCSPLAGVCKTSPNGARDLYFDFNKVGGTTTDILSGGVGIVASNYIDFFTKFTFFGGTLNTGLGAVPGTGTLHGESVSGYGLYVKSQFNGVGYNLPEERRATCVECGEKDVYPIGGVAAQSPSTPLPEMTYIGFHDDARIHTQNQKSLLEAPVIEFFGHAEIDTETDKGSRTEIKLKADSLIFHDSAIFAGNKIVLAPYTSSATERNNDMRFGVINDRGASRAYYAKYGPAIEMVDRGTPVLELGYQRCFEPLNLANESPNAYDDPWVGGDIIVTFKYGYKLPMFNTVVANHARISFITDSLDGITGGEYINTFIRTDLLRIRNYVEFYTDPTQPQNRSGKFVLATVQQMDDQMNDPGIYMRHLHMEPGSELSVPGEDSILVIPTTVVGGYGEIHENIRVKADGIVAPGFASLMEGDCQTWYNQGKLTVHNLIMEEGAQLRISISSRNDYPNPVQTDTIKVKDSVFFFGEIGLDVLPEVASLPKGCYLFFEYLDTLGVSKDYVKNLKLNTIQYGDKFFALDFSEVGKVYLCVTEYPVPTIQRWIDIPEVETVFTEPNAGRYFAGGHQDFSFKAYYTSGVPFQVKAKGYYTENVISLDGPESRVELAPSTYQYTIFQIIEPWTVFIGPELSTTANESLNGSRVWAYRNTLYINVPAEDVVSVYNVAGMLNKKLDIKPGINKMTLERGVYVVTLKDGTIHKIVIK